MDDSLILEIKKVGLVNHALIELGVLDLKKGNNGHINIIAGKNSTGKTTISKILYTVISTISNEGDRLYKKEFSNNISSLITALERFDNKFMVLDAILTLDDSVVRNSHSDKSNESDSKNIFSNDNLRELIKKLKNYRALLFDKAGINQNILNIIEEITRLLEFEDKQPSSVLIKLESVKNAYLKYHDLEERLLEILTIILKTEFTGSSLGIFKTLNDEENGEDVFNVNFYNSQYGSIINIKRNEVSLFGKINESSLVQMGEVYYLETPFILDFYDNDFKEIYFKDQFPLHHQNSLATEISQKSEIEWDFTNGNGRDDLSPGAMIRNIINGYLYFDDENGNFKFQSDNQTFDMDNTSSGIKNLGILQLLLDKELEDNSFFIIDEPEVHLHPNWIVEFAKAIVMIAKTYKIHFYINSHSPQFIEAIEVFSQKHKIENYTNFYLLKEHENNMFNMEKVDRFNIEKIHDELGKPYDIIDDLRVDNLL
ncbi:MAG: ATP-binding protein [Methanobrevibacter sp.]|nr:ATP-binding protein [Methanobrevibacter sp.]